MVVLTINLSVQNGRQAELRHNFLERFLPAVSRQPGFVDAKLATALEDASRMLVLLMFDSEQQRLAWVNSAEHDPAWESVASLCTDFVPVSHEIVAEAER